ncbi:VOC family protein [Streptomyces sp. NPDC004980]
MAGEVSFFELGAGDAEQARTFYGGLFGWTFEPGPGGGFAIGTPNVPGGLHGGDPGSGPYLFFAVDDLESAVARVRELGGTADGIDLGDDDASAARFGRFQLCHDDQGSPFGLHQPPDRSSAAG